MSVNIKYGETNREFCHTVRQKKCLQQIISRNTELLLQFLKYGCCLGTPRPESAIQYLAICEIWLQSPLRFWVMALNNGWEGALAEYYDTAAMSLFDLLDIKCHHFLILSCSVFDFWHLTDRVQLDMDARVWIFRGNTEAKQLQLFTASRACCRQHHSLFKSFLNVWNQNWTSATYVKNSLYVKRLAKLKNLYVVQQKPAVKTGRETSLNLLGGEGPKIFSGNSKTI